MFQSVRRPVHMHVACVGAAVANGSGHDLAVIAFLPAMASMAWVSSGIGQHEEDQLSSSHRIPLP